ncbi:MAG: hypothetical protein JSV03_03605 [Planctomycetota bacterium]|nr:MAG: hypothetical protein JSV03_03605 [Planctomycetota bacterium]
MVISHKTNRRVLYPLVLALIFSAHMLWADEPFDYFENSWSVIGLKDYRDGTRISPENELLLAEKDKLQLKFGRSLTPLSRKQTKTLLEGWLPVVLLTAEDEEVRYAFTLWATPLPTVNNWHKAFDWPGEGENFLIWIKVKVTNIGLTQADAKLSIERITPSGSKITPFKWSVRPGQSVEAVARIPYAPIEDTSVFDSENPKLWLNRTVEYWQGMMTKAARIKVPCLKATQAMLAAHVCQLIANDHGELHGGEGFYDTFYIRDGGYQIMELEEAGLFGAAHKAVNYYLRSQLPEGRFETQKGQFDANGQALWVFWQFYKITGDREWLTKVYPQMRSAVDWAMKARRQASADSPFAGLLPAALADGEYLWDGKHHIVGYDFWNLRGLLCTAEAAKALGKDAEAKELFGEADSYRADIEAAWKRTGLAHFPPSWEKEGTHWGNTEILWPTMLFVPDDPRVTALQKEAREVHGGGFVEGTIRWLCPKHPSAIHPYMSAYTTMASLIRGEHEQVVKDFYWYLLHSTATHAFAEGIYYKSRTAWNETIPHVTVDSNYALSFRHMLMHEHGDELHLLPAVPDWWLEEGKEILVERAPTHFGEMSFRVCGLAKGVEVTLEPPSRNPPERIVLHLPQSRSLINKLEGVEVELSSNQTKRWDFATVIKLYREQAKQ